MNTSLEVKCHKCGKPVGYVAVTAKSFLVSTPTLDNINLVATCPEWLGKNGLYCRNF